MKKQILAAAIAASLVAAGCLLIVSPAIAADYPTVEVAYSPDGGPERLVLRTIDREQQSIRLMGYTFTPPAVVPSLLPATRRGVDVQVTVDYRCNIEGDRSGRPHAALGALAYAGVHVRVFSILHGNRNPQGCYMAVHGCFPESANIADAFVLRQGGELA